MDINLKPGITHQIEKIVTKADTAASYNSGLVEVLATPAMIALMEGSCQYCVQDKLAEGFGTVGYEVNIRHLKPTAVGKKVTCNAELLEVDRKKLRFKVVAYDEEGKIGEGTHIRYIIDQQKFMEKL